MFLQRGKNKEPCKSVICFKELFAKRKCLFTYCLLMQWKVQEALTRRALAAGVACASCCAALRRSSVDKGSCVAGETARLGPTTSAAVVLVLVVVKR